MLGLCETSTHLAAMMGGNFALITGNEKHATRIVENVGRYGLREKLHGVHSMSVARLVDLDTGFTDAAAGAALVDEFLAAAGKAAASGAEVVIPAIGVLMVLLAGRGVHSIGGTVPVLNGVVALVKTAESVVRMRRLMAGNWTSKRASYAPPPASQIDELRRGLRGCLSRCDPVTRTHEHSRPAAVARRPPLLCRRECPTLSEPPACEWSCRTPPAERSTSWRAR